MSIDDEGRFGVVGGRGGLAHTTVDKHTHEWVETFGGINGQNRAWRLVRKLNRAWREERERRIAAGTDPNAPWERPE